MRISGMSQAEIATRSTLEIQRIGNFNWQSFRSTYQVPQAETLAISNEARTATVILPFNHLSILSVYMLRVPSVFA